jgi:Tfp pilus assembly protein PilO
METITIKVDQELAKAYQNFEPLKRQEIENLLSNFLKKIIQERSLDEIIEDLQQQAKSNGLTQEILEEILKDE